MPKAATVKHSRFLFAMYALYAGLVLGPEDSASKSSIRRFVITEKAPTRAFSVITNLRMQFGCNFLRH